MFGLGGVKAILPIYIRNLELTAHYATVKHIFVPFSMEFPTHMGLICDSRQNAVGKIFKIEDG